MTEKEWAEFLRAGTRTAKLATVLTSGRPTATPVWYLYESDGVIRKAGAASAKVNALRRDRERAWLLISRKPP